MPRFHSLRDAVAATIRDGGMVAMEGFTCLILPAAMAGACGAGAAKGSTRLVNDLCVVQRDAETKEMTVTPIRPGLTPEQIQSNIGWPVRYAAEVTEVTETPPPTTQRPAVLRELYARAEQARGDQS
jgi:hypothetical protein